jgi:hypothetical protein
MADFIGVSECGVGARSIAVRCMELDECGIHGARLKSSQKRDDGGGPCLYRRVTDSLSFS